MANTLTQEQIDAGAKAGRKALQDYSAFDSSMVPDDALEQFVIDVGTAIINVVPTTQTGDSNG
jgi:hypothetical protein